MRFIDTHSHVYFPHFDEDRDAVYERMRAAGVETIVVGTNLETSTQAVATVSEVPDLIVAATIGLHPTSAVEGFDAAAYEKLLSEKVVGVGECGLDYYRNPSEEERKKQRIEFDAQIEFALAHNLPLMLHVRAAQGTIGAHHDVLAILDRYQGTHGDKVRGTCHFFTAPPEIAQEYWKRGFATSFPGVITFAKECEEAVRIAPQEYILAETDAPYAAPKLHRGQRNEPAFVAEVVRHIAGLRGEEEAQTAEYLVENTKRIFNIV